MDYVIKAENKNIKIDLVNFTIILTFLTVFFQQTFNVSGAIYFFIDLPIVIIGIKYGRRIIKKTLELDYLPLTILLSAMFIFHLIGASINKQGILNLLYGIYKYYRGFLFFIFASVLINKESCNTTISIFRVVFWINLFFTAIQFLFLHLNQDRLGGFFGTISGVNQYTNLFFTLVGLYCIYQIIIKSNSRSIRRKYLIAICVMMLIASLAELKYFFVEIIIMVAGAMLLSKKRVKTLITVIIIAAGIIVTYRVLIRLFPEFSNLIEVIQKGGIARLIRLQQHYSTETDIGRASFFSYSNRYYLTSELKKLYGLGIGSVSSSQFADNSFWRVNHASHYDQFSTAYLYIEQGIIGFILYISFYVIMLYKAIRSIIKKQSINCSILMILAVINSLLVFIYNQALFSQLCFLNFWCLAFLYSLMNNKKDIQEYVSD